MGSGLPTPPRDELPRPHGSRKASASPKSLMKRSSKRGHLHVPAHSATGSVSNLQPVAGQLSGDARHKRVWKACERCRMKKTKCDGEFPCRRCKDDGLICMAGFRKKPTEFKQIPPGYAEVLENTQFGLVATIHKLYAMVRSSQTWELGEPVLNERGQPVVHDIAQKLGCLRPNDLDLPVQAFPENESDLAELISNLEAHREEAGTLARTAATVDLPASSPDLDYGSDLEPDYRRAAFGGGNCSSVGASSPRSLYTDIDARPCSPLSSRSPIIGPAMSVTTFGGHSLPQSGGTFFDADLLNRGLLESEFGTLKPHVPSCPNPEVMMGTGDPMIFSGPGYYYDPDILPI